MTFSQTDLEETPALRTRDLRFRWSPADPWLAFPDLTLAPGTNLFLKGPSGSGKSTLLSLVCGLAAPQQGRIEVMGQDLGQLSRGERDALRANHLGVIFQQFNLVPYLSVTANTLLPCRLSAGRRDRTEPAPDAEAKRLLSALAVPSRLWSKPVTQLSVGQQQRVAAARALIGAPRLILADEPTSALDRENRDRFLELLLTLAGERRTSVLFVSHDDTLARHFDHLITLGDPA
ncbi:MULTISPECIES: ABC transporter ATP-binding protein [Marinobacter]|uniref:ABC transporter ATP-binding protein n=1 Tax=Marinobacter TaxID=2742 RepID=UPI001D085048|nr:MULTISPECIES: ABC transporter ATP-binding protein [Marinobacter]MCK7568372.1 ABC transporter ATP-binding protein [Marinobacter xestospongiae]UDL04522.1 ABC transporter ATP-binding protein [Marinobacter sp. CA1]